MFEPWQIIIHLLVFCMTTSPWKLITMCDLRISLLAALDIVQSTSNQKELQDRCLGWIKRLDLIFPIQTRRWEKRQELTFLAAQLHPTSPTLNKTSATYGSTQSLLSGIIDYFNDTVWAKGQLTFQIKLQDSSRFLQVYVVKHDRNLAWGHGEFEVVSDPIRFNTW